LKTNIRESKGSGRKKKKSVNILWKSKGKKNERKKDLRSD